MQHPGEERVMIRTDGYAGDPDRDLHQTNGQRLKGACGQIVKCVWRYGMDAQGLDYFGASVMSNIFASKGKASKLLQRR